MAEVRKVSKIAGNKYAQRVSYQGVSGLKNISRVHNIPYTKLVYRMYECKLPVDEAIDVIRKKSRLQLSPAMQLINTH